ncbi:hypothetical protein BMS3Abin05_00277 [bacterium BMS3Abin05]|nr:hypothetical protein BMS3Abin05_00277 [bacterium BMS3Abin05]
MAFRLVIVITSDELGIIVITNDELFILNTKFLIRNY